MQLANAKPLSLNGPSMLPDPSNPSSMDSAQQGRAMMGIPMDIKQFVGGSGEDGSIGNNYKNQMGQVFGGVVPIGNFTWLGYNQKRPTAHYDVPC